MEAIEKRSKGEKKAEKDKSPKGGRKKKSKKKKAHERDKFELYQESVQNPPFEVSLFRRIYRKHRNKEPLHFREDFCGTALLCCEWVTRVKEGSAVGVDLDGPTLAWGYENNVQQLKSGAHRIRLERRDVLEATDLRADVVGALNFSYFVFKKRGQLRSYFEKVYESLLEDGIFILDLYGGPEAQIIQEETTEQDSGFDYVWDQAHFNPITGETKCYIHFDFPKAKRMKRAFTYDWRLWTLPEVLDLLEDVGFRETHVYWEGTDEDSGSGNGVFRVSTKGDDARSWIAYVAALR